MNLPDYDFISAPLWVVTSLHVLTLTLHFAAMNFVVGGVIITLWGRFTDRWNHPTVRMFLGGFPTAMAATVSFGVAPLLFLQLVYFRQVYAASIVSGWFWLMIVAAVIFAYYFLYGTAFSRAGGGLKRWYLGLALLALLYVSYVYSSVFSLAERPDYYRAIYAQRQSGLTLNPYVGEYLFRWLHMLLGAVTVGGFFVGLLGRNHEDSYLTGRRFFLWGTVAAAIVGLIYFVTLGEYLVPFMRTPAVWILTVGIVFSALSVHFLYTRRFAWSGALVFLSLLAMVISRHYVRLLRLADHFQPSTLRIAPQWSIFAVFVICLVLAAGLIWYMLRAFFGTGNKATM
ncbi:MAG TPA: hypothetical protein VMY05_07380 [Acidobacteriota bacterium]|nr:hypothetical protein [Acidobacteriota bacterium]